MTTRTDDTALGALQGGAEQSRPIGLSRSLVWSAVACFALLTWAGARIAVPLPFTPVPGTLQTLAVLLAGLFLGARAGAASQVLYVSMGLAGLPVFALPGAGPGYLLGPTGGYLLGFALAAWVTGWISGKGSAGHTPTTGRAVPAGRGLKAGRTLRVVAALVAGSAVIHASGLAWLTLQMGGSLSSAWALAPMPFALFDLTKIVLAAAVYFGAVRLGRAIGSPWSRASER